MEKFKKFQLTAEQQRNVVGGQTQATATADCGDGRKFTCSGTSCRSTDGQYGSCNCDGISGQLKFC